MAQVRSRPKKGPLKPVASVADGMLTDSSANVAVSPMFNCPCLVVVKSQFWMVLICLVG